MDMPRQSNTPKETQEGTINAENQFIWFVLWLKLKMFKHVKTFQS